MEISLQLVAANCNPVHHGLARLPNSNIVAYCAANQVLIHNTKRLNTAVSLNLNPLDPGRCNSLQAYSTPTHGYVVAGYDQGYVAVFECPVDHYEDYTKWRLSSTIKQEASIIAVQLTQWEDRTLLSSINNKAACRLYEIDQGLISNQAFAVEFPLSKIPEAVCLFPVNDNQLILAVGGMDQCIHLYVAPKGSFNFVYVDSLKGHEDAITRLTTVKAPFETLLASASKDGSIRVWKIARGQDVPAFQKSSYPLCGELWIYLQSILTAHECSVTNLAWSTSLTKSSLTLVSTSMDCTVGVWQRDESGVWLVRYRLGQLYGNKNAFFSVMINDEEHLILTVNFTGASCVWQYQLARDCFEAVPSFSGHFSAVTGLAWSHTGDFLVSCSKDQTSRVYCRNQQSGSYGEISRAQIHGYDINTIGLVPIGEGMIDLIASGADEKVIRIIEPSASTANLLNCHTRANLHLYFQTQAQEQSFLTQNKEWLEYRTTTEGGTQVLGLMTKAQLVQRQKITTYYESEEEEQGVQEQGHSSSNAPMAHNYLKHPTEDYMTKHTLWPEMNKLYGHPYELSAIAVGQRVLASSCHSLNNESAFIIVWDSINWKIAHQLHQHKSTVNDLKYSPDGEYFAAVSKDRSLSVFSVSQHYKLLFSYEAHSRAITACDISSDSRYLATVSRDKSLKIHDLAHGRPVAQHKLNQSLYSVAYHPERPILACGCEDGSVILLQQQGEELSMLGRVPDLIGHSKLVSKLCWKSHRGKVLLASCSHDHSVRIYEFRRAEK